MIWGIHNLGSRYWTLYIVDYYPRRLHKEGRLSNPDYHGATHPEKFSSQPSPHSPWLRCCMSTKTLLPADLHRLDTIEARDRREAESPKASVPPAQSQFVMKCGRLGVEQVAWSSGSSSTPITGRCFYRAMATDARSDVGRCSAAAF
jgi:hypothetical protein